eukprot:COSAG03_NODE_19_length_21645_cov_17.937532_12_plen_183_part_00
MKPYQLVHTSSQCKKHRGRDHDRASPSVRSSTSRARLAYYSLCTPLAASASTRASSITHVACLMSVPPLSDSRARSPAPGAPRTRHRHRSPVPESRRVGCRRRVEREPRSSTSILERNTVAARSRRCGAHQFTSTRAACATARSRRVRSIARQGRAGRPRCWRVSRAETRWEGERAAASAHW